jgi:hypothetical protein
MGLQFINVHVVSSLWQHFADVVHNQAQATKSVSGKLVPDRPTDSMMG